MDPRYFRPTEVATQEVQFTGEPITLTLKDADIKDVLRTFSALTQLNLDQHNRVPTTDTRLIRRIVRDATHRGYTAGETIGTGGMTITGIRTISEGIENLF